MLFKTAFLSLLSHRSKSVLMLTILSICAFLTLAGFTVVYTIEKNMRTSLTETVSGDILIYNSKDNDNIDILQDNLSMSPIEEYSDIIDILKNVDEVKYYTELNKNSVTLNNPMTEEYSIPMTIIGTNVENYINIFDKYKLVEGTMIPEGESGILINKAFLESLKPPTDKDGNPLSMPDFKGKGKGEIPAEGGFPGMPDFSENNMLDNLLIGNKIKVASYTSFGSQKVTELTIYGYIEISDIDSNMFSQYSLVDIDTYQSMSGYDAENQILTVAQKEVLERNKDYMLEFEVTDEESGKGAFDEDTLESLFDEMVDDNSSISSEDGGFELDLEQYKNIEESDAVELENKSGSTDFVILRLHNPKLINDVVDNLNNKFTESELDYKAISYIESSSTLGSYINLANIIITTIIFITELLSIIIITNSILISVIERTNEIGTMRAIGAQKQYIFKLIFSESFIISIIAFIVGNVFGFIVIGIINLLGIQSTDMITTMLFGGSTLNPIIHFSSILYTFLLVVAVTMVASIYPVSYSVKLTPLDAMNKI